MAHFINCPIFLIGYMGCGKSTLGKALHSFAGVDFVDLDHYIEDGQGMTIKEIFAQRGEEAFRQLEKEALREVSERKAVIACGGGTPCREGNMELMNECGITVWLNASVESLHRRLCDGRAKRPLIANKNDEELLSFIQSSLAEREPYYGKAQYRFNSERLECIDDVKATTLNFIARFFDIQKG